MWLPPWPPDGAFASRKPLPVYDDLVLTVKVYWVGRFYHAELFDGKREISGAGNSISEAIREALETREYNRKQPRVFGHVGTNVEKPPAYWDATRGDSPV